MACREKLTINFKGTVRKILLPELFLGVVLILDNVTLHKAQSTRLIIKQAGCRLLFAPVSLSSQFH